MTGTCLCGAVDITIDTRPEFIHDCNCSLCRKSGAAWGYFPASAVTMGPSDTATFVRRDKENPAAAIHSCSECGATTHFTLTEAHTRLNPSHDQVGVNMKLFEPDDLDGVEVRYPDGRAWNGKGPFGYRRAPMMICATAPW